MKKILVVVDMQNDFITGSLGTEEAQKIVPNVEKKIESYIADDHYIIMTQDTHEDDYLETLEGKMLPVKHCIADTEGWKIHESLIFNKQVVVLEKCTFGTFQFAVVHLGMDEIKDEDEIEIVGLCTDICVISNALILRSLYPNNRIICDASCCAGTAPEKHDAALEVMKSCQIEVINEPNYSEETFVIGNRRELV
jgi:nicotinamidase-related amidase